MNKKKDNKKQLSVRVEPAIAEKIKIMAKMEHTSQKAIIEKIINYYYKHPSEIE